MPTFENITKTKEIHRKLQHWHSSSLIFWNVTGHGDGSLGFANNAPYHKIMVTCGSPQVPKPLVDQLDFDGLMVIPVGGRVSQELLTIKRTKVGIEVNRRPGVAFVPMIGTNAFES